MTLLTKSEPLRSTNPIIGISRATLMLRRYDLSRHQMPESFDNSSTRGWTFASCRWLAMRTIDCVVKKRWLFLRIMNTIRSWTSTISQPSNQQRTVLENDIDQMFSLNVRAKWVLVQCWSVISAQIADGVAIDWNQFYFWQIIHSFVLVHECIAQHPHERWPSLHIFCII